MTADAVGGVWTYATELADALRPRGAAVTLAVLGPEPSGDQVAGREAHVCPGRLEWQDDPWDDVSRAGDWLLALADDVDADVVHLNGFAHGALAWRAPALVVGHSCVLSWWEAVRGGAAPREWDHYRRVVRAGLLGADAILAPTRAMLDALRRLYGLGERGSVIPNGVRDGSLPAAKEPFVLAAGRLWDEAKGLDVLDAAAPRIPWPVEVAGERRELVAARCRLLGRLARDDLRARMEAAAIFAHPARYEPFGLAPLEAGLAGCALVLGDIPSLREVWGEAATYVPPGDADALVGAVAGLAAQPALREEMGGRARRRARKLSAGRMAGAYLAVYDGLRVREAVRA